MAAGHPGRVIGLGGDGAAAAVCAVSTVNFALRSPAEQDALTAAYGRWLHSLTGPVQILIRTGHADWLGVYNAAIMTVLFLIIAAKFIGDATSGLV